MARNPRPWTVKAEGDRAFISDANGQLVLPWMDVVVARFIVAAVEGDERVASGDAMERAVEAAARILYAEDVADSEWLVEKALEAAAPILRADERERVLAPIRALAADWPCSDETCDGDCTGCGYGQELRAAIGDPS